MRFVKFTAHGMVSSYRVWDGDREVGEVHLDLQRTARGLQRWLAWDQSGTKVAGSFLSRGAAVDALLAFRKRRRR